MIPIVLAMGTALGLFMGYLHPDLQPSALHHHPGGAVPGARAVLRREHRHHRDHQRVLQDRGARPAQHHRQQLRLAQRDHRASSSCWSGCSCRASRKFGRTVYAIGGNEQSAVLMGLPVGEHEDRDLRPERILLGAGRDRVHLLHALGLRAGRKGDGAGRHRHGGDRRHPADRRSGQPSWERCWACWCTGSSRC